jgi:hypothetical protein
MSVANTITFPTTFDDVLQDRLDHPTTWKEMCDVIVSDTYTISSSYMSTTPSVQSVTRGTGHSMQTFSETAQTANITTGRDLGLFQDWGDKAQSPWTRPLELFDRIGALLNEFVETNVLAQHGSWTDFDNASIGGSAGNITVSASNVDDIIRGVKREIRENNGQFMMNQYGVGFVWRAADFEYLEAFVQANGFANADSALKEGTVEGLHYLGVDNYWSNDHASGHVFAGVKKTQRLGILKGTYGRAHTIPFPAGDTNTYLSGESYYSRIDIGHLIPTAHAGILFDVLVA